MNAEKPKGKPSLIKKRGLTSCNGRPSATEKGGGKDDKLVGLLMRLLGAVESRRAERALFAGYKTLRSCLLPHFCEGPSGGDPNIFIKCQGRLTIAREIRECGSLRSGERKEVGGLIAAKGPGRRRL